MSYFQYNTGQDVLPPDVYKISPSRLSRFFDDTSNFYRETVFKETPVFQGNTSSVLGTCVHGLAAMYKQEKKIDFKLVEDYLCTVHNPEVDIPFVRSQYPVMAVTLIDTYVQTVGGVSESFVWHEVMPGIVAGGSIDLLLDDEIVDYKTTSSLSAPTGIPRSYWFQQMAYAWILKQKGIDIKKFTLQYITQQDVGRRSEKTGKPLKDYPCTVTPLTHIITGEDWLIIDNTIRLVAESVKTFKEKPELQHLLAQDLRLKVGAPRNLFNQ